MTDRERLLKILNVPIHPHENVDPLEAVADFLLDNGVTFAKDTNVPSREKLTEQAEDILDKWEFFYGQRAGRELWAEKPEEIQNADIEAFCRDLAVVRSVVTDNNDGSKWIPVSERLPEDDLPKCSKVKQIKVLIAGKAMLSQPMAGKTEEEIVDTREKAIAVLRDKGYEVVNTLFTDEWYSKESMESRGVVQIPLCFLAKSLENMSLCHAAYFCKGWEKARGCKIEHDAAVAYGLTIIYEE